MSKSLQNLISVLSLDEQRELEKFALYLLLRRKITAEQIFTDDISSEELMQLARQGGFDWLESEPDLYSFYDEVPVKWPQRN